MGEFLESLIKTSELLMWIKFLEISIILASILF